MEDGLQSATAKVRCVRSVCDGEKPTPSVTMFVRMEDRAYGSTGTRGIQHEAYGNSCRELETDS